MKSLNSAGRIADYFIDSKLTPVIVLLCLLAGLLAALFTPREENPQIPVPGAEVLYSVPGRSASEVERLVAAPVERALRQIEGVDHTLASSAHGQAKIAVQFNVGVDKEIAMVRVYQSIDGAQSQLPGDVAPAVIKRVDVDDIAVVTVTLASERYDDYALRRLAERLKGPLNSVSSVSRVELHGGTAREMRIEPDPARLEAFGLSLAEGLAALSANNLATTMGHTLHDGRVLQLRLHGELRSAQEVRDLALGVHDGQLIYVDDVATVHDGPTRQRSSLAQFGFGPGDPRFEEFSREMAAVTLSVAKKPGENAVTMAREVLSVIETLKAQFIPADVHVVTTRDDGAKANNTVNNLLLHMAIATASVILSLLPFLGLRSGLIISFVVPLILSLTLLIDMLTGLSINRVSLFAMIMALGMIVDDSIVVLENIYRSYQHAGKGDPRRLAVLAVNEIGPPTTIATFAVVLVFASMQLLTGMNGAYFAPISFNVQVTMALSLLFAYLIVPWACLRWLRGRVPQHSPGQNQETELQRRFFKVLSPLLHRPFRRRAFYALTLFALILSMLIPVWQFIRPAGVGGPPSAAGVLLAIMPKEDRNTLGITMDMPEGTPVEQTHAVARHFATILREQSLVTNYTTYVGMPAVLNFSGQFRGAGNRRGPHQAEITINLVPKNQRRTQSGALIQPLREFANQLKLEHPGLDITIRDEPPGPPSEATVAAEIYGSDAQVRAEVAAKVRERFEKTWGVVDVYDSTATDHAVAKLRVDQEKAVLSGVSIQAIEQTLANLLGARAISEARIEGELAPVPIMLSVPREYALDPLHLDRVHVVNQSGQKVPISELLRPELKPMEPPILRKDNEPYALVAANLSETAPIYAILDMNSHLDGLSLDNGKTLSTGNLGPNAEAPSSLNGYRLLWEGELRLTLDAFSEMGLILAAALLLVYLLLVATYRSFALACLAMVSVPLGFIGIFPGHWLLGIDFSMGSAIGVIALSGVVIRNSLLILDFIRDYLKDGHPLEEAVKLASAVRFRPIMLSALTVALGTLILYTDPLFAGLATSLIFGTATSTGLTLLLLPTIYFRLATRHPTWIPAIKASAGEDIQGIAAAP